MSEANENRSGNPNDASQLDSGEIHRYQPLPVLAYAGGCGLLCVLLFAAQMKTLAEFTTVAFTAILLSGASLLVGGALGFLFGIPRTLQSDPVPGDDPQKPEVNYRANTNLEQISDWLTKMLVGVGLTQLPEVTNQLDSFGKWVGPALGDSTSASVMGIAILLYFVSVGFLFGFLWTRLYLASAFREADIVRLVHRVDEADKKLDAFQQQSEMDSRALSLVFRQLTPDADEELVSQKELDDAIAAASPSARAQVFNQAWRLRKDNWRSDKPLMERSIPVFRALIKSDEDKKYHRNFAELGYALKDKQKPEWNKAEANLTSAIERRDPAASPGAKLYEFNRAICRIMSDAGYSTGEVTDPPVKEAIVSDLIAAKQDGWSDAIANHPEVMKWMELNDVTLEEREPEPDRE